ncbi:MAG: hypothetical protein ABI273_21570 [Lacunisphaera sp.]
MTRKEAVPNKSKPIFFSSNGELNETVNRWHPSDFRGIRGGIRGQFFCMDPAKPKPKLAKTAGPGKGGVSSTPLFMDKKALMKQITEKVGRDKAIDLVMQSYNTELLTTLLNRLEEGKARMIGGYKRRDQLADALERVAEVCDLTV